MASPQQLPGGTPLRVGSGGGFAPAKACCCDHDCEDCESLSSCEFCDCTPQTWLVVFGGTDVSTDCVANDELTASGRVVGGANVDGGVFSGVFCLTQDAGQPCSWGYDGTTEILDEYSDGSGTCESGTGNTLFSIRLTKISATQLRLTVTTSNPFGGMRYFCGLLTVASGVCDGTLVVENNITGYGEFPLDSGCVASAPGDYPLALGKGGVAVVQPCC